MDSYVFATIMTEHTKTVAAAALVRHATQCFCCTKLACVNVTGGVHATSYLCDACARRLEIKQGEGEELPYAWAVRQLEKQKMYGV